MIMVDKLICFVIEFASRWETWHSAAVFVRSAFTGIAIQAYFNLQIYRTTNVTLFIYYSSNTYCVSDNDVQNSYGR